MSHRHEIVTTTPKKTCLKDRVLVARDRTTPRMSHSHWTKASARTYVNMFEGPVTGNIPEVLDNGEVTDGTHVTAGQLALALTPYAQVADLAVNTAASGNNAAAIPSLDDRVTAERHGLQLRGAHVRGRQRLRPLVRQLRGRPGCLEHCQDVLHSASERGGEAALRGAFPGAGPAQPDGWNGGRLRPPAWTQPWRPATRWRRRRTRRPRRSC